MKNFIIFVLRSKKDKTRFLDLDCNYTDIENALQFHFEEDASNFLKLHHPYNLIYEVVKYNTRCEIKYEEA